jgi:RimJ/RimL family protein N-acetyltransferase
VETERLELRPPVEADRARFVELFQDPEFMVFSNGVLDREASHARFDRMLHDARDLPFAKQPVIERTSGLIVGYSGAAWFDFEAARRLEFGYRLVPGARGRGYATEAGRALMEVVAASFTGEVLATIDPRNAASHAVIRKLGFVFWRQVDIEDYRDDLYRRVFT